ncbi:MAG: low molecular weight phosphatase family protein [Candidatus Acidiferrales bacterium]
MGLKRRKVLFVCIGNSCRSQMAEAIARHCAADLMEVESAGTSPLGFVARETLTILQENGIRAEGHYSKGIDDVKTFFSPEIVVNMSGRRLDGMFAGASVVEWKIKDPYGDDAATYQVVYAEIGKKVKMLVEELRIEEKP